MLDAVPYFSHCVPGDTRSFALFSGVTLTVLQINNVIIAGGDEEY